MDNKSPIVIGIDVGGTNLRIGGISEAGSVIAKFECNSKILVNNCNSIEKLIEIISSFIQENHFENIKGISLGFPATISKNRRIATSVPNLSNGADGFDGKDIVGILGDQFAIPIFLNKDANMLLQADISLRKLGKDSVVAGIYFGTGIGNGIYFKGDFWYGNHGTAGALGHIPFYKSDDVCACGNIGCSECHASGNYLYRIWEKHFSATPIKELFINYSNHPILLDFIDACAVTIATEINILDPDLVIIGGGIIDMPKFPFDNMIDKVKFHSRKPLPANDLRIVRPIIIENAGIVGAALYGFEMLKKL